MGTKRPHFFLFAALLGAVSPASAVEVASITVQRGTLDEGFELEGSLAPVHQVTLSAQVSGNLTRLSVKAGDRVKAGQAIAQIDERDTSAGLQRSEASLAQAQAEATAAKATLDRSRKLRSDGFVSQAALEAAESTWKAAQAAVQQAQAGRSQAALARGNANVIAPFDGVIQATHLDAGDLAAPGRPIATLYAPGAMRAVVQLGVSRIDAARAASRIDVILPSGREIRPARVTELASADPVSQTVEWRLDLPSGSEAGLTPGQSVRVRFADAPSRAGTGPLRVPAAALLRRGELTAVYVVQGSQHVLRAVRVGRDHGAAGVDVLAGLKAGERVAADALRAGLADARPAP